MSSPPVGTCLRCGRELTARDLVGAAGNCPACGAELEPDSPADVPPGLGEAAAAFEGLDLELINRLARIPRENSWQLLMLGELVADQAAQLRAVLRALPPPPAAPSVLFRRLRIMTRQLTDTFEGLLMALGGLQEVFCRDLGPAAVAADLAPLRAFHDRLGPEVRHLGRFHEQAARLAFPRASRHRRALAVLLTWGPWLADELEQVADRLRTHGRLPRARLVDWPVQLTLAPPSLPAFVAIYQELRKD